MSAKSKIKIHLIDSVDPHESGRILVGCGADLSELQRSALQTHLQHWRDTHYPQAVAVTVEHDYRHQQVVASVELSPHLSDEERERFKHRYGGGFTRDISGFLQKRH